MFPVDSKILVVDDSHISRSAVKASLTELKYWKILEAEDGKKAQELFLEEEQKKDPIHLIICDLQMPNVSGSDLLKWIRSQPALKNLPAIVMTASQDKTAILEIGRLGASHLLVKPFNTGLLRERMASTWQKHGQAWVAALTKTP